MTYLNIKSADRDSGSSSSFRYTLTTPVKDPLRVSLVSAEIPIMTQNVRSPYNYFTWTESGTSYTATVTAGSYSTSDLLTALATAMNAKTSNTYTFTESSTTLKITLATTNSITITSTYLSTHLGFTSSQSGTSITATNSYCINVPDTYWNLCIRNLTSNYIGKGVCPTFKIPITVDSGYILYHSDRLTFEQSFVPELQQLGYLDICLYDSYGYAVDLQGLEWSFTLKVQS